MASSAPTSKVEYEPLIIGKHRIKTVSPDEKEILLRMVDKINKIDRKLAIVSCDFYSGAQKNRCRAADTYMRQKGNIEGFNENIPTSAIRCCNNITPKAEEKSRKFTTRGKTNVKKETVGQTVKLGASFIPVVGSAIGQGIDYLLNTEGNPVEQVVEDDVPMLIYRGETTTGDDSKKQSQGYFVPSGTAQRLPKSNLSEGRGGSRKIGKRKTIMKTRRGKGKTIRKGKGKRTRRRRRK